ncbi:hypothetical protein FA15DRAFT_674132 [Coprinopsis marcescibilis]|uniref:Uncharacterized protein n=1 Tax=Coprinopsis marcescibilis TaxID=230819 RepID=A0A5C3KHZ7_COPMA|nr:hypothetical protein FA15DRAFT_674132 [Coprinopsis marcescibilis]
MEKRRQKAPLRLKMVVVGSSSVGKTCLVTAFTKGFFPETFSETYRENHIVDLNLDGVAVEVTLWDTIGNEDYDRLRWLTYHSVSIFILCYGIDMPDSLEDVSKRWVPELVHLCPESPIMLVGCKKDVRQNYRTLEALRETGQRPLTEEEGMGVAQEFKFRHFVECSAKMGEGIDEVFDLAAREAKAHQATLKKVRPQKCVVL